MRTKDKNKNNSQKAIQTINFDVAVLRNLESRAKAEGTTISRLVNMLCLKVVMTDVEFYREMSKYHLLEMHKYQFLKNEAENMILVGK